MGDIWRCTQCGRQSNSFNVQCDHPNKFIVKIQGLNATVNAEKEGWLELEPRHK